MIEIKTTTTDVPLRGADLRENAFTIYQSLLESFDTDELMLLESLGINSVDSRVSMIGINPVFTINIKDRVVTIQSNTEFLHKIKIHDDIASLIESSCDISFYQLKDKNLVWEFLKDLEKNFIQVPKDKYGILTFCCFSYETIHYIETIPQAINNDKNDKNDVTLILYQSQLVIEENKAELINYTLPGVRDVCVNSLIKKASNFDNLDEKEQIKTKKFSIAQETKRDGYFKKVRKALHHINIGDIYQVQIGHKIQVKAEITPIDVYRRLRQLNPSPYMYLCSIGGETIIGASPELFLRINTENEILMRPIAGTLGKKKGVNITSAKKHLQSDIKEVAEHMMLVDLCRNDIYRFCNTNSLNVSSLLDIEEYSHVYHMVSTATATLKQDTDKYDAIVASFPAGTMTGAPKVRAMEIISKLEDSERGRYAGALGILGMKSNYINTALCIRTATEENQVYTLRASAGVVSDSEENSEYLETLHKMGSMFKAITGEEISCHVE
ncbi:anthranilate synthase component I family protein [Vibrio sp.]|uniref:anthranilate synthase component I family protein n=1 Tax=Vibrio sp. TaxID=678 RepID=UPI00311F032A